MCFAKTKKNSKVITAHNFKLECVFLSKNKSDFIPCKNNFWFSVSQTRFNLYYYDYLGAIM